LNLRITTQRIRRQDKHRFYFTTVKNRWSLVTCCRKNEPNIVPSASYFVAHMQELAQAASASIEQRNKATAAYQNAKRREYEFGAGDKVLLSTKHFKPPEDKERRKKLAAKFAGPYEIIQVVSPHTSWRFPPAHTPIQYSTPVY
jgi:hypothetical protein